MSADAHAVRWILVHLTPFAPDCAERALADRARWIHQGQAEPLIAMRLLLRRLGRRANQVVVRAMKMGDLGVFPADDSTRGYPLAFIVDGVTEAEARDALMTIAGEQARELAA